MFGENLVWIYEIWRNILAIIHISEHTLKPRPFLKVLERWFSGKLISEYLLFSCSFFTLLFKFRPLLSIAFSEVMVIHCL